MKVNVYFDGQQVKDIELQVRVFEFAERCKKAAVSFFVLFVAAIISVFIPVLHFILVPALLIACIVYPIFKFKERTGIDLTQFNCPNCKKNMNLKSIALKDDFFRIYCPDCRKHIQIELLEQSEG